MPVFFRKWVVATQTAKLTSIYGHYGNEQESLF